MSDPTGLRGLIEDYAEAEPTADWEEAAKLDIALAALDARLARLTRFVRAWDAGEQAAHDPYQRGRMLADQERRAARDAITEEDLA